MKESDIRPADLLNKYLELCAEDAVTYFGSSHREDISCPACTGTSIQPAFMKQDFGYVVCKTCGTLYNSPRPSEEDFVHFYERSISARYWAKTFLPSVAEARRIHLFRPKVEEIARLCKNKKFSPEVVADVGAGHGLFLDEWQRRFPGTKAIAIEPNPDSAEICRSKNITVVEGFVEQATDLHGQIDMVVAQEVIEHVYDPMAFSCSLKNLLRDGGRLLLTGQTVDGFDIQVLWEESKSIYPPNHINFISVRGFKQLFTRAGFSKIDIFTPGKLDVDIVKNAVAHKPHIVTGQRFIGHLLKRDEKIVQAFQKFLQENQLSSHCWIWAEK
ncbi:MAG: class I SAM-dependent methyltransferase [bacterium]